MNVRRPISVIKAKPDTFEFPDEGMFRNPEPIKYNTNHPWIPKKNDMQKESI